VVGLERPAVDKLLAVEVLVSDVEAAEDLNRGPVATASATSETRTLYRPNYPWSSGFSTRRSAGKQPALIHLVDAT
jgi:hypothetical protein